MLKRELEGSIVGKRLHPSLKEKLQTAGLNSWIEQLGPSFLLRILRRVQEEEEEGSSDLFLLQVSDGEAESQQSAEPDPHPDPPGRFPSAAPNLHPKPLQRRSGSQSSTPGREGGKGWGGRSVSTFTF